MIATDNIRGWIRESRRHKAGKQRALLEAAGAGVIYVAGEDSIDDLIASLRVPKPKSRGDVVLVSSLARLAKTRDELGDVMREIHARGAVIIEARDPPRRSDKRDDLAEMLLDAVAELSGDKRTPTTAEAKTRGAAGGKARGARLAAERTPVKTAIVPWRDLSHSADVALTLPDMEGWDKRTAYRVLGPRNTAPGTRAGRPKKPKHK